MQSQLQKNDNNEQERKGLKNTFSHFFINICKWASFFSHR